MANKDILKLKIDKPISASGYKKKKPFFKIVSAITALLLIAFIIRTIFSPSIPVEVAVVSPVYPSQALTLLTASGYVVAQRKAAVASKITGRLVWIGVEEGSFVKKGQIIARLESDDAEASKEQATANLNVAMQNLEQAKAEMHDADASFKRNKEMLSYGYVSQAEYDASEARYKKAVAAVASAESAVRASRAALKGSNVSLHYTIIRAPFDAVVLTKNADIGDIVTPIGAAATAKAAVITIADMDSLQVEADVSESDIHKVIIGQPCDLQLDALPDSRFRGVVHMIVPTADRTKATVMVKVRFIDKDKRILPEMSAKVAFLSRPVTLEEQKPKTTINPAAIVTRNRNPMVFIVQGDRVVETPVILGSNIGDMKEVLSGVKIGDRIVLNPPKNLKNNSKIKLPEK